MAERHIPIILANPHWNILTTVIIILFIIIITGYSPLLIGTGHLFNV